MTDSCPVITPPPIQRHPSGGSFGLSLRNQSCQIITPRQSDMFESCAWRCSFSYKTEQLMAKVYEQKHIVFDSKEMFFSVCRNHYKWKNCNNWRPGSCKCCVGDGPQPLLPVFSGASHFPNDEHLSFLSQWKLQYQVPWCWIGRHPHHGFLCSPDHHPFLGFNIAVSSWPTGLKIWG